MRPLAVLPVLVCVLASSVPAAADAVPEGRGCPSAAELEADAELRTHEDRRLAAVLACHVFERVPEELAQGRRIAFVRIIRDDVFIEGEGLMSLFTWANAFHWLTKKEVIRRELLLREGDAYRQHLAEETMRNLRDLGILTYARMVPVEARDADEVGLVVYTRDLWSLRLESGFQLTGGQLDYFLGQVTERNFLGRHKSVTLRYFYEPDAYQIGQLYFDRRLFGGHLSLFERGLLIFNRETNRLEGGEITGILQKPFFNLQERFAFELRATYFTQVERQLRNGEVIAYDIPETSEEEQIPRVWRDELVLARLLGLYRRGTGYRQTFGLGWEVRDHDVRPNAETGLEPGQEGPFARDILPLVRREIGPILTYEFFTPTFVSFENLGTYGQTETVQSGPSFELTVRFPVEAFGSSSDSLVFQGRFGQVLAGHDAMAELELLGHTRLEDGEAVDQRLRVQLRGATPEWAYLRLAWRFTWDGRRNDTARTLVTLGGDNGLRGFVSQAFFERGGSLFRGNVEIRTAPFTLWSIHMGLVLFYDFGAVYGDQEDFALHHAVGLGARLLFPQLNRTPFRGDLGVPVGEGDGFELLPSLGTSQVVPLTPLDDEAAAE